MGEKSSWPTYEDWEGGAVNDRRPCCRGGENCPNAGCFVPDVLCICQTCQRGMEWHCCHYCCQPCEQRLEEEAHAINYGTAAAIEWLAAKGKAAR